MPARTFVAGLILAAAVAGGIAAPAPAAPVIRGASALTIAPSHDVYVADVGGRVTRMHPDGTVVWVWTEPSEWSNDIKNIAVATDGTIYGTAGDHAFSYSPSTGTAVLGPPIGPCPGEDGTLGIFSGIAVTATRVLVGRPSSCAPMVEYTRDLTPIHAGTEYHGTGPAIFHGRLYSAVEEPDTGLVSVYWVPFPGGGTSTYVFGEGADVDAPLAISDGTLYRKVNSYTGGRTIGIAALDAPQGSYLGDLELAEPPWGYAVDDGRFWYYDYADTGVSRVPAEPGTAPPPVVVSPDDGTSNYGDGFRRLRARTVVTRSARRPARSR